MITNRIREIPYNYTSYSDREIVIRLLGEPGWQLIELLRGSRRTGRSARMLFEVLGDMWVITRNPYVHDDLLNNPRRREALIGALRHRLHQVETRANGNQTALQLLSASTEAVRQFESKLATQAQLRHKCRRVLGKITASDNIDFSGLARVAHSTDATDWRVAMPFVVIKPDRESETAAIVRACIKLGLTIIPRGGGTGYTGGAIPLHANTAVINTEKLERLGKIVSTRLNGVDTAQPVVECGAGVITRRVAVLAEKHGLAFAVDPTSQDASTIGGNVSMNAGGKKAVIWGTTLDNLVSWRMVTPDGLWLEVERLQHNLGKIHQQKTVRFRIQHFKEDGKTPRGEAKILQLPGSRFRQPGLGKDVTDKYLAGLPGIQKEGCDGLITSAKFILHRMPKHIRTLCLEFFAADIAEAVPAIVEVKNLLDNNDQVLLTGLEHLDERYLRAVKYTTKAAGYGLPRMLLLADICADDESLVDDMAKQVVALAARRSAQGFIASSSEARQRFWLDRSRTAAISSHTNAFKINEDVVIPLPRLAEYNRGIERINIEQSISNKLKICDAKIAYLNGPLEETGQLADSDSAEFHAIIENKCQSAMRLIRTIRQRWADILENLDQPAEQQLNLIPDMDKTRLQPDDTLIDLLLRRDYRITFSQTLDQPLKAIFAGEEMQAIRKRLAQIHQQIKDAQLFVALHMHAGDGNVHTNIPVHSENYTMLREADKIVARIMALAISLDGVISGEHGIGLTKIQYLDAEKLTAFKNYKNLVDPEQHFNRDKLLACSSLELAYTPSLRLLQQEALILEYSELGQLNDAIKNCLRCGKCKPECMTHVPRANLYYSPRDKILATGLMIEAFLYEEQTRRGVSLSHFSSLNDIADHCTTCHKCLRPCPVNIDFGDVSIQMRNILVHQQQKKTALTGKAAISFLNMKAPVAVKIMRLMLARGGFLGINIGHFFAHRLGLLGRKNRIPPTTTGTPDAGKQIINLLRKPIRVEVPRKTSRALLNLEDDRYVAIIRDPQISHEHSDAVFYFPGCGSERLFSQIAMATLNMLYAAGAQTVLPPGYLCCGYPQTAAGLADKGQAISTENRVLFYRIATTLNYLDIKTVIVSCGTCMDQLLKYEFENIFPGCRLLDIHEYLLEKGLSLPADNATQYIYHDPCHTPIKTHHTPDVVNGLLNKKALISARCCGEAGTLGTARPDIAEQLHYRKQEELSDNLISISGQEKVRDNKIKLLTSCPACQQGLARYADDTGLKTDYIVVEMSARLHGKKWEKDFIEKANNGGIERVLL